MVRLNDMIVEIDGYSSFFIGTWMGIICAYDDKLINKSDLMKFFLYEIKPERVSDYELDNLIPNELIEKHKQTIAMVYARLLRHRTHKYLRRDIGDEIKLKAFFDAIEYNQSGNKAQWLSRDYYYIAYNGRLAKIRRGKTLDKLLKDGVIVNHRAKQEINGCGAQFVKHRRIIERIGIMWSEEIKEQLGYLMDGGKDCQMVIDRNFKMAYDPEYGFSNHVFADDLCCGYSCMSRRGNDAQDFYGKIHGCSVVRFYEKEDDEEHQVGRCLVYEQDGRRHFIRIYGKRDYFYYMLTKIQQQMKDGDLLGRDESIPNMRLETDWDGDETAMYLDGDKYGVSRDCDTFYVGTNYENDFKSTSKDTVCARCCGHICEHCGRFVDDSDAIEIDGEYYCDSDCASMSGYECCERCGYWHARDDMIYVRGSGYYCDAECARSDGYEQCSHCGEWSRHDNMIEIDCYYYCDTECAESDGWEYCDGYEDYVQEPTYYCPDKDRYWCEDYVEGNEPDYELVNNEWVKKQDEPKDETND